MTVEVFEPSPIYLVQGAGPYEIPHPYAEGSIRVVAITDTGSHVLDSTDFTVSPPGSDLGGNVFLIAAVADELGGQQIVIDRLTVDEQGWKGLLGERERGLEVQLDRMTMGLQEVREEMKRSVRGYRHFDLGEAESGRTLIYRDGGIELGPNGNAIAGAQAQADRADTARRLAEEARDAAGRVVEILGSPVSYAPQALNDDQRAQARSNIQAIGTGSSGRLLPLPGNDLNAQNLLPTGVFGITSSTVGAPDGVSWGTVYISRRVGSGGETQLVISDSPASLMFVRSRVNAGWSPWSEIIHGATAAEARANIGLSDHNTSAWIMGVSAEIGPISPVQFRAAAKAASSVPTKWVFTESGTWEKPVGLDPDTIVNVRGWGGGGAGARVNDGSQRLTGGGGGGGCLVRQFRLGDLPDLVPVEVGAGGVGPSGNNLVGGNGGNSYFAETLVGTGGGGGGGRGHTGPLGGRGGGELAAGSNGQSSNADRTGQFGGGFAFGPFASHGPAWSSGGGAGGGVGVSSGNGSRSGYGALWGGAGGGANGEGDRANPPGLGGVSVFGGNGGNAYMSDAIPAQDGEAPGGGGGSCTLGPHKAGDGARGEVWIWL